MGLFSKLKRAGKRVAKRAAKGVVRVGRGHANKLARRAIKVGIATGATVVGGPVAGAVAAKMANEVA